MPSPRVWLPGRWGWDARHGAHLCQPVRTMPWKRSGAKRGMACITRSQLSWFLTWWFRGGQACAGPVVPLKALANHTASKPLSAYLARNCPAASGSGVTLMARWRGVARGGQGPRDPGCQGLLCPKQEPVHGGLLGAGRKVGASVAEVGGKRHPWDSGMAGTGTRPCATLCHHPGGQLGSVRWLQQRCHQPQDRVPPPLPSPGSWHGTLPICSTSKSGA